MSSVRYNDLSASPQEIGAEPSPRGHENAMTRKKAKTGAEQDDDEEVLLREIPAAANMVSVDNTDVTNEQMSAVIGELKTSVVQMDCSPADALSRYNDKMEQYQRSVGTSKRSIADIDRVSIDVALQDDKFPLPLTLKQINMLAAASDSPLMSGSGTEDLNRCTTLTSETANELLSALSKTFPGGPSTPCQEALIEALKGAADGTAGRRIYQFFIGNGIEGNMMNEAEKSLWRSGAMLSKQIAITEQLYNDKPSVYMSPAEESLYFRLRESASPLPPISTMFEVIGKDLNLYSSWRIVSLFTRPDNDEYKNRCGDVPLPYEHFLTSINDIKRQNKQRTIIHHDAFFKALNTLTWSDNGLRPPFDQVHRPISTDEYFKITAYWRQMPANVEISKREQATLEQILSGSVEPENTSMSDEDEDTKTKKQKSWQEVVRGCSGNKPASRLVSVFQRMRAYPSEDFDSNGEYFERVPDITTGDGAKVIPNINKYTFNGNWDVSTGLGTYKPADKADKFILSWSHVGSHNNSKTVDHLYIRRLARLRIDVYTLGIEWIRERLEDKERGSDPTDWMKELKDTEKKLEWAKRAQGRIEELCLKYPETF